MRFREYINESLPNKPKPKSKRKTVSGVKYEVRESYYGGMVSGWNIFKNGKKVAHHNGKGLKNKTLEGVLNWAIENV